MSRNWPTFNPAAACPKCSHAEVRADWRPRGSYANHGSYGAQLSVFDRDEADWIQRICERCHYQWPEECFDRTAEVPS